MVKNFVGQKENKEEFFQKLKFNFEKSIFFQFEQTNVQVKIKFVLQNL